MDRLDNAEGIRPMSALGSSSSKAARSGRPAPQSSRSRRRPVSTGKVRTQPPRLPRVKLPPLVDQIRGDVVDDPSLADHPKLVVGTAGDHASLFPFLCEVFQGPSHDAFVSSLDDPFYEPKDRILVKHRGRILSHVHVTQRALRCGLQTYPVSVINHLGTLAECRGQGFAHRLLEMAEQWMREDGSVLGVLRTSVPHFFRPSNWALCGRHCFSRGRTREVLAQIHQLAQPDPLNPPRALTIRPWRQIELSSVMQIYRTGVQNAWGAQDRTEPFWRWLVSRKAFDQLYVAIDGPDHFELDAVTSPIVGYAITRQDHILELMVDPAHPHAALQLLARACGEGIERDDHHVVYHGAPNDPMHGLFSAAGASLWHHETHGGEVSMIKLLDPAGFLRSLGPQLHQRADAARLARPCELGLLVEGKKFCLTISRRSVKLSEDKIGRSYLNCNLAEFTRLLLGHTDVAEAVASGRIETSTRVAMETAGVLFPRVPWWQPPFDRFEP